jgi:hypothetical protein
VGFATILRPVQVYFCEDVVEAHALSLVDPAAVFTPRAVDERERGNSIDKRGERYERVEEGKQEPVGGAHGDARGGGQAGGGG